MLTAPSLLWRLGPSSPAAAICCVAILLACSLRHSWHCGCVCSVGCRHHSPGAPVGCLKPLRRACQDVRRSAGGLVDAGLDWAQPWQLACSAGCLQSHCLQSHVAAIVLRRLSSRMAARFGQEPWCDASLLQSVTSCGVDNEVGSDSLCLALVRYLLSLRCQAGSAVAAG